MDNIALVCAAAMHSVDVCYVGCTVFNTPCATITTRRRLGSYVTVRCALAQKTGYLCERCTFA